VHDGQLGREVCEFGMTPKQGKARESWLPPQIMADLNEYDPAAAEFAFTRTVAFLRRHLIDGEPDS